MGKDLQSMDGYGKIMTVKDGYLVCPICRVNKKVQEVPSDTVAHKLVVWCRNCKWKAKIDIVDGQCFESRSQ